jgi:hypothetical protein
MRTKTLLVAAAALTAGIVTSQAQVYSQNVVGYVNLSLPAGLTMVANPLNNTTNDLNTIIPTAGFGDTIYIWTGTTFNSSIYVGSWSPDVTMNPGQGFFYAASSPITLTFTGNVLQGSLTNTVPAGFSILGNQVPVAEDLSTNGFPASFGDTIYFYRGGNYVSSINVGSFAPAAIPAVGEGFWVNSASGGSWTRSFTVQ